MADQKTAAAGQADLAARKADLDAREAAFAERERVAAHKESEAFCERLMRAGTLVPGLKSHAVTIMDHLAGGGGVVEFAEAGAENPVKKTVLDIFRDFLDHLPKAIEFAELAGAGVARSAQLGERAREYQASQAKEGRKVDIGQAVRHPGRNVIPPALAAPPLAARCQRAARGRAGCWVRPALPSLVGAVIHGARRIPDAQG